MPYVNVRITKEGVTAAKKRAVIKGITDVLARELGKDPDYTFVVIDEVETDNWGWRGTTVTEIRKAAKASARPRVAKARSPVLSK